MFKEHYEKLLEQLAVDYNCTSSALRTEKTIITVSAWN